MREAAQPVIGAFAEKWGFVAVERGRVLTRMWRFLRLLQENRNGRTVWQLAEALAVDKSTIYRDKNALESAGIFLEVQERDGAAYWTLPASSLPRLALTEQQRLALMVMQPLLEPLQGSALYTSLEDLFSPIENQRIRVRSAMVEHEERIVAALDEGLVRGRRLKLSYAQAERQVEVQELVVKEGALYAHCFDIDRDGLRTFKVSRITSAEVLPEACTFLDTELFEAEFEHSLGVWGGTDVDVAIRVLPSVAGYVNEWPLCADQGITVDDDGSALVTARVAGLREVMRWTLRWGRNAVVESPEELRDLVVAELEGALFLYRRSHAVENGGG